jgi:hypothetical protein
MGACGDLRDELHTCQLLPISVNETDQETLEYKRAHAARTGDHLCVVLNGQSYYECKSKSHHEQLYPIYTSI